MRWTLLGALACAPTTPPTSATPTQTTPESFGAFRPDRPRRVPDEPGDGPCMDVTLADLDLDDDLDVVLSLEGPANAVLENDGAGNLTRVPVPAFRSPTDSEQAVVTDLDGDGCPDLYFANEDFDRVDEYYLGDCMLRFVDASATLPVAKPADWLPANAVHAADLDGDEHLDLLLGHRGQSAWWRGSPAGFTDATDLLPVDDLTTQDLAVADLDGDGDLDVVLANEGVNALWRNDGARLVAVEVPWEARETRSVAVLDADLDGTLDLVFGNVGWTGLSPQSELWLGDGVLGFVDATDRLPVEDHDTLQWLPLDIDQDGDEDLLAANTRHVPGQLTDGPWLAWRNDGDRFVDVTATWLPSEPMGPGLSVAAGDLDGDGWTDLYLCARGGRDRVFFGEPG